MNSNIKNIVREKIIRLSIRKKELFLNTIKSIRQNNNISNNIKNYTNFFLKKLTKTKVCLSKKNKICFYTGKRGGVLNNFNFSRYTIKSLIIQNKLTNVKKNNW